MALIPDNSVFAAYIDGQCARTALLSVKKVNAGDTVELVRWFSEIDRAVMLSATSGQMGVATAVGTIVTIPTGPVTDGVWILAFGVAAPSA